MNPCRYHEHLVVNAQDEPGYPLARKRRAHFPKTIFKASHQWPPNRPAELHPHEGLKSNERPLILPLPPQKLARHADQKRAHLAPRRIEAVRMMNQPPEDILRNLGGLHPIARHMQRETKNARMVQPVKSGKAIPVPIFSDSGVIPFDLYCAAEAPIVPESSCSRVGLQ